MPPEELLAEFSLPIKDKLGIILGRFDLPGQSLEGVEASHFPLVLSLPFLFINSTTTTHKTLGSVALASSVAARSSEASPDWGTVVTRRGLSVLNLVLVLSPAVIPNSDQTKPLACFLGN